MAAKTRIAVIIPVFNREQYVVEALESVDKQTRVPDAIVVVDDGSTDRSVEKVKSWVPRRAPMPTLIVQPNQGATVAMNKAIECADAELIAPLDSDDVFLPMHLERLESVFARHPNIAVCCGNSGRLDTLPYFKRRGFEEDAFVEMEYVEDDDGLRLVTGCAYTALLRGAFLPTCSTMFPKEHAVKAGMYDESMRTCYDTDFWLRMSKQGRFAFYMDEISLVRKHDGNLTHRRHIVSQILSQLYTYEKMIRLATALQLSETELERTRSQLATRRTGAVKRASRYGVATYLTICKALIGKGDLISVLHPKSFLRALARPYGDSPKV